MITIWAKYEDTMSAKINRCFRIPLATMMCFQLVNLYKGHKGELGFEYYDIS